METISMVTMIFSNGIGTIRKPKQSIKAHIKEHEKQVWINEFMRIDNCDHDKALKAYNETFKEKNQ